MPCCGRPWSPTFCRGSGSGCASIAAYLAAEPVPALQPNARTMRGEQRPAGALTASLEAARAACNVGAPAEELQHLEAALALWSAVPDAAERAGRGQVALLLETAATARTVGELHRAVALLRSALPGTRA